MKTIKDIVDTASTWLAQASFELNEISSVIGETAHHIDEMLITTQQYEIVVRQRDAARAELADALRYGRENARERDKLLAMLKLLNIAPAVVAEGSNSEDSKIQSS